MPFLHILKKRLYLYICVAFWLLTWYIIIDFLLLNQCLDCLKRWLEHSSHPLYSFALWLCHRSPQKVESPSPWICFGLCFVLLEHGRGNTVISDPWPQGILFLCSLPLRTLLSTWKSPGLPSWRERPRIPAIPDIANEVPDTWVRSSWAVHPPLNSQLTAAMKVTRARPAQPTHGIVRKNKLLQATVSECCHFGFGVLFLMQHR